jgi:hypothetical protein
VLLFEFSLGAVTCRPHPLHRHDHAEEVSQETVLCIFKIVHTLREDKSLRACWLRSEKVLIERAGDQNVPLQTLGRHVQRLLIRLTRISVLIRIYSV